MTDTASLASMALLAVCIAANTSFGPTAGAERLEGLFAEYGVLAARAQARAILQLGEIDAQS